MRARIAALACGVVVGITGTPVIAQAAPPPTPTVRQVGTATSATAPLVVAARPGRAKLRKVVKAVAYERVYGSKYGHYKKKYPRAIDWRNNGCSVPRAIKKVKGVGWVLKHYSNVFQKSCDRHDFGYRNYGKHAKGLALDSTAKRRKSIDNRFHSNMDYQCKKRYDDWWDLPARGACYKASDIFYKAVRGFGGGSFY